MSDRVHHVPLTSARPVPEKNWHARRAESLSFGELAADVVRNRMGSWRAALAQHDTTPISPPRATSRSSCSSTPPSSPSSESSSPTSWAASSSPSRASAPGAGAATP
jgi:hypothetical protein